MREIDKPPALSGRGGLWLRFLAVELHLGVDPDFRPAGKAHPAFGVADLDTLADRIAAAGHPVRWDAALDERRRFFTDDPVGNRLEFIEAAPAPDRLVAHFSAMARNSAWANDRLLEACEALDAAAFAAPRVSFFPSLRRTLNHLYGVDVYYLDALEETGRGLAAFDPDPDFAEPAALRAAQAAADRRLIGFCDRLTAADLDRRVMVVRDPDGRPCERTDALLAHLFQHQIHHRGQAHAMLAGTAVPPPQLDEFFLDFDRHPSVAARGFAP